MNPPNNDPNKTCYSCGKTFLTPTDLARHKKRKTPCLIREISDADRNNPLRCIYCNKIFSKANNLNRHHGVCKVKNGGMQTLHDKVKYEESLRIIQEEQEIKNKNIEAMMVALQTQMREENAQMKARIEELEAQNKALSAGSINNINNSNNSGTINNIGTVNNITIAVNNFDKPKLDHIRNFESWTFEEFARLFNHELAGTPLAIWYDPKYPENRALHLVNKKNGETLIIMDGKWVTDNISRVIPIIRHIAYELTQGMIRDNYQRLINFANDMAPGFINLNHSDEGAMKRDAEEILQKMIDGRAISQPAVDSAKSIDRGGTNNHPAITLC
jgi:hypothetical protein